MFRKTPDLYSHVDRSIILMIGSVDLRKNFPPHIFLVMTGSLTFLIRDWSTHWNSFGDWERFSNKGTSVLIIKFSPRDPRMVEKVRRQFRDLVSGGRGVGHGLPGVEF